MNTPKSKQEPVTDEIVDRDARVEDVKDWADEVVDGQRSH